MSFKSFIISHMPISKKTAETTRCLFEKPQKWSFQEEQDEQQCFCVFNKQDCRLLTSIKFCNSKYQMQWS